jgi:hypothetical protein
LPSDLTMFEDSGAIYGRPLSMKRKGVAVFLLDVSIS